MAELIGRLQAALGDRYRVEEEIGAGGMATVFRARDVKHDREVALKVLRPELAARVGAERFLQEIRVTARLQHPNILPPSLVVLPLDDVSPRAEELAVTDGLHAEIVTQLNRLGGLKAISRTSALAYADRERSLPAIARELGVSTVLEGNVRLDGDRIRVVVRLVDALDDDQLWTQEYDRALTAESLYGIQRDVALNIARELRVRLTSEERTRLDRLPTTDLAAYRLYLRGRQHLERWTPESVRLAIQHFEEAIEADPEFAAAYAALAAAYGVGISEGLSPRLEELTLAEEAANRALELDPAFPVPFLIRGWIHVAEGRYEEAMQARERWVGLGSDEYSIEGCVAAGRGDRASAEAARRPRSALCHSFPHIV